MCVLTYVHKDVYMCTCICVHNVQSVIVLIFLCHQMEHSGVVHMLKTRKVDGEDMLTENSVENVIRV